MKWRKLYKEAVEEVNFKKLLKQNGVTKLPSGTQFKPDRVSWSKDGGYAGQKTLDKICSQLEDAGWERGEWRTGGVPDGSAVSNSNAYTSPDGQLVMTYCEHYGATAHDNFYSFTFKLTGGQVNEARITGAGRIDFDDDIVAVYTPDGKLEYKGILDECPYKDDDMKYDKSTMSYRVEGPRGDYRIIAKVAESQMNESSESSVDDHHKLRVAREALEAALETLESEGCIPENFEYIGEDTPSVVLHKQITDALKVLDM